MDATPPNAKHCSWDITVPDYQRAQHQLAADMRRKSQLALEQQAATTIGGWLRSKAQETLAATPAPSEPTSNAGAATIPAATPAAAD